MPDYDEPVRNHRLQVLVSSILAGRIRKAANRKHLSRAEWVRRAIEQGLVEPQRAQADSLDRLERLGAPTADIEEMLAQIHAGQARTRP